MGFLNFKIDRRVRTAVAEAISERPLVTSDSNDDDDELFFVLYKRFIFEYKKKKGKRFSLNNAEIVYIDWQNCPFSLSAAARHTENFCCSFFFFWWKIVWRCGVIHRRREQVEAPLLVIIIWDGQDFWTSCIVPSRSVWNPPPNERTCRLVLFASAPGCWLIFSSSWIADRSASFAFLDFFFDFFLGNEEKKTFVLFSWQFMQIWATVASSCLSLNRLFYVLAAVERMELIGQFVALFHVS